MPDPAAHPDDRDIHWIPAIVVLALVAAVIGAALLSPVALGGIPAEDRTQARIGLYERVVMTDDGTSGSVTAGYLAPAGWSWVESRSSGAYLSPDRRTVLSVELRGQVPDPEALLRADLPPGASLLPATHASTPKGLPMTQIAYDLAAGGAPGAVTTVCTDAIPASCLLIRISSDAQDDGGRRRDDRDLRALLAGIEIV